MEERLTQAWKDYRNGVDFQCSIGLDKMVNDSVDFYEGRQWKPITDRSASKNFPRPVLNVVKMICRNKKANIVNSPVNLVYKSMTQSAQAEKFTRFSDYILKEMEIERLDSDAVKNGTIKGTYIYHFYYDTEKDTVKCELIDVLDVVVSNPKEVDEQKQDWIIIAKREMVDTVRKNADSGVDKSLITEDTRDTRYNDDEEQDGSKLCTVLTKYFRKNGEVFFERVVKGVIVNEARSLTPDLAQAREELTGVKVEETNVYKCTLYPIVIQSYEARDKCIYGLSEVYSIIPDQQAINYCFGLYLLAIQDSAYGTIIVKEGALRGQKFKSGQGQLLIDYSKLGNGISRLREPAISGEPLKAVDAMMSLVRTVTGATEVMSGEAISANMSGAAIAQLQAQANLPIKELRDRFWRAKEKQGKILAMFFKAFYRGEMSKDFAYIEEGSQGQEEKTVEENFNGAEYDNVEFRVNVEATAGASGSIAGDIGMLESLFAKGAIDSITYANMYPADALLDKQAMVKAVENMQNSQMAQLQAQNKQIIAQNQQAMELIQKQSEVVNNIMPTIKENNQLKADLAQLQAEYTEKINQSNQEMWQIMTDAQIMAQELDQNNAMNSEKI